MFPQMIEIVSESPTWFRNTEINYVIGRGTADVMQVTGPYIKYRDGRL